MDAVQPSTSLPGLQTGLASGMLDSETRTVLGTAHAKAGSEHLRVPIWCGLFGTIVLLLTASGAVTIGGYLLHTELVKLRHDVAVLQNDINKTGNHTSGPTPAPAPPSVPAMTIALWAGALASAPHGWTVCDGSRGTPDLRGKFVMAASSKFAPGSTDSEPAAQVAGVYGFASPEKQVCQYKPGVVHYDCDKSSDATTEAMKLGSQPLPPYYTLVYIMRVLDADVGHASAD